MREYDCSAEDFARITVIGEKLRKARVTAERLGEELRLEGMFR